MKTGFYAAFLSKDKKKHSMGLHAILTDISKKNNSLQIGGSYIFIHLIDDKTFLFTKTNDSNLIQKINKSTSSIEEIKNSLADDESLGFPSFVFVDNDIVGFSRTMYGPTTSDLSDLIKNNGTGSNGEKIVIEPLMQDTSKSDVMTMDFIGRTTVKVEANTNLFRDALNLLGTQDIDEELLDCLEIVIKPKRKRNIKDLTKAIVSNPSPKYADVSFRGKNEAGDVLTEHYLSEKGHLHATINKSTNADIAEEIKYCFIRMKPRILDCLSRQVGAISP